MLTEIPECGLVERCSFYERRLFIHCTRKIYFEVKTTCFRPLLHSSELVVISYWHTSTSRFSPRLHHMLLIIPVFHASVCIYTPGTDRGHVLRLLNWKGIGLASRVRFSKNAQCECSWKLARHALRRKCR